MPSFSQQQNLSGVRCNGIILHGILFQLVLKLFQRQKMHNHFHFMHAHARFMQKNEREKSAYAGLSVEVQCISAPDAARACTDKGLYAWQIILLYLNLFHWKRARARPHTEEQG